jgi:hypothetical protein
MSPKGEQQIVVSNGHVTPQRSTCAYLVAQALATTSGHQHEAVLLAQGCVDDVPLLRPEAAVAKHPQVDQVNKVEVGIIWAHRRQMCRLLLLLVLLVLVLVLVLLLVLLALLLAWLLPLALALLRGDVLQLLPWLLPLLLQQRCWRLLPLLRRGLVLCSCRRVHRHHISRRRNTCF